MFGLDTFLILNCIIYVSSFEKDNFAENIIGKSLFEISDILECKKKLFRNFSSRNKRR